MNDTPLPRIQRARFETCPPPQPGLIVAVLPPPTMLGAPVLVTQIGCVLGDTLYVLAPGGMSAVPTAMWPPPDIIEVRSAGGELLWRRMPPEPEV